MELANTYTVDPLQGLMEHPPAIFKYFSREDLFGILNSGKMEVLDDSRVLERRNMNNEVEGYLIVEGSMEAFKMGQSIEQYGSGDFIGEGFLHSRALFNCELRTTSPCTVLIFTRKQVLGFFRDRPEKLLKIFTMNVIETQQRHICMLYKRIADILKNGEDRS